MEWYVLLVKVWANRNIDDIGRPSNTSSEYIPQRKFFIGLHEDIRIFITEQELKVIKVLINREVKKVKYSGCIPWNIMWKSKSMIQKYS